MVMLRTYLCKEVWEREGEHFVHELYRLWSVNGGCVQVCERAMRITGGMSGRHRKERERERVREREREREREMNLVMRRISLTGLAPWIQIPSTSVLL